MSTSVYYQARRAQALSTDEIAAIERIVAEFNAHKGAKNCEDMDFYERVGDYADYEDGVLLQGALKPSRNLFNVGKNMRRILASLSALKRVLPDAEWDVSLDDLAAHWDEVRGFYFD